MATLTGAVQLAFLQGYAPSSNFTVTSNSTGTIYNINNPSDPGHGKYQVVTDDDGAYVAIDSGVSRVILNDSDGAAIIIGDDDVHVSSVQTYTSNKIIAGGGDNTIVLEGGNNAIRVGDGDNLIETGWGNDTITSGDGDDTISAGGGNDLIRAGDGNDLVVLGYGNSTVFAGSGNDTILGGYGSQFIDAEDGNDLIIAGGGDNTLLGGVGNDTITGSYGNDSISGGAGNDSLTAGWGDDTIDGGAGNDTITAGSGVDKILKGTVSGESDRVTGFTNGMDKIIASDTANSSPAGFTEDSDTTDNPSSQVFSNPNGIVSDYKVVSANSGADSIIIFRDGSRITLVGVPYTDIDPSDFATS